jgi:hypothetical protein
MYNNLTRTNGGRKSAVFLFALQSIFFYRYIFIDYKLPPNNYFTILKEYFTICNNRWVKDCYILLIKIKKKVKERKKAVARFFTDAKPPNGKRLFICLCF